VRAFEPEAIFLSTGFDAHAQEEVASPLAPLTSPSPLSPLPSPLTSHPSPLAPLQVASLALRDEDFAWITAEVAALGLPTVSVLEGGYNLGVLKRGVRCHLDALIHGHGDGRC
jgi:acetoin utilization deacetylase AcuC-like enzyme